MVTLRTSDILQINATIVAGVLILLTISSTQESNPIWQLGKGFALVGWVTLLPFCGSALYALKSELKKPRELDTVNEDDGNIRESVLCMILGFITLIVYLGIYSFKLAFFSH